MNIPVIYEDNHLLVVQKPRNMGVCADKSGDRDLLSILKEDIKYRYNKPGNVYLGLVHRLDRPVGGVMVFARTSKAAGRMAERFKAGEVERVYRAVTKGRVFPQKGELRDYLLKDREANLVRALDYNAPASKLAVLRYQETHFLDRPPLSLLKVELVTGRAHQIRTQMSHAGHPVWGDRKYGGEPAPDMGEALGRPIALWAHKLSFTHPTTGEVMTFISELPNEIPWTLFGETED